MTAPPHYFRRPLPVTELPSVARVWELRVGRPLGNQAAAFLGQTYKFGGRAEWIPCYVKDLGGGHTIYDGGGRMDSGGGAGHR